MEDMDCIELNNVVGIISHEKLIEQKYMLRD